MLPELLRAVVADGLQRVEELVLFFGRNGRIYHSGGHRHWNVGFYIFFMIFSLIYLAVRVWVSLIVTKLYSLLMKIGEHRAKEVDDHHNYDAKCACMP